MRRFVQFGLLIWTATWAFADQTKIAEDLQEQINDLNLASPTKTVDVIVRFTKGSGPAQEEKVRRLGGILKGKLDLVKGAVYSVPVGALKDLSDDVDVTHLSPDRKVKGTLDYAAPTVNAGIAWDNGWKGKDIGVAIIDSGISNHPDLTGRIVYSESFLSLDPSTNDLYGHGTHVAGIAAGNGVSAAANGTVKISGIAPGAKLPVPARARR